MKVFTFQHISSIFNNFSQFLITDADETRTVPRIGTYGYDVAPSYKSPVSAGPAQQSKREPAADLNTMDLRGMKRGEIGYKLIKRGKIWKS